MERQQKNVRNLNSLQNQLEQILLANCFDCVWKNWGELSRYRNREWIKLVVQVAQSDND